MSVADKYRKRLGVDAPEKDPETPATSVKDKYRARLKQIDEQPAPAEQTLGPDESNWVDRVNAVGQGASFGFADEIGAGLAAGAAKLAGSDEDFGDIYGGMMESEAGKRRQYAEQHPAENLALQVAGGLTSGGAGLVKAVPKLAAKMGGGKLATTGATMAVGGAEGGLAGFGSTDGDVGERLEGAGFGATVGAMLPAAISGAGQIPRIASKRRVEKDLVNKATGEFTPITVADKEGALGSFYRDVVSPAFGSGKLKEQVKPFAERAEKKVNLLTKAVDRVKTSGKKKIDESNRVIRERTEGTVDELSAKFRNDAVGGSFPATTPPEMRTALQGRSQQEITDSLSDEWVDEGFSVVKDKIFDAPRNFKATIKNLFADDPALTRQAGDYADDLIERFNSKVTDGKIAGDEFMELRNSYARSANTSTDPLQRKVFNEIKHTLDGMIEGNLDLADLPLYRADKESYDVFNNMRNATGKAGTRKGGEFTPDEWLSATKNQRLARGTGPLQKSAQTTQEMQKGLKKSIKQQVAQNPVKQNVADMSTGMKGRLTQAKKESADMKKLTGVPTNLFRTLAATSVLGAPTAAVTRQFGDTLFGGIGAGKLLSTQRAQKMLAGQTPLQEGISKALRKYDKSGNAPLLLRGGPSAAVAGREDEFEDAIFGRK